MQCRRGEELPAELERPCAFTEAGIRGLLGASKFLAGLELGPWGCEALSGAFSSKWVLKRHFLLGCHACSGHHL